MSAKIHHEINSMRKSQRIKMPLQFRIDHAVYTSIDWSHTGISIAGRPDEAIREHQVYDAALLLGMDEATLSLQVKLKSIYIEEKRSGFEFVDLSEKNKKVLRRYLELYLEGKLEIVDQMVTIYQEPMLQSAVTAPIKLQDHEKSGLEKSFRRKSFGAFFLSFLLLSAIAGVVYYNFLYEYELIGTVEGNTKRFILHMKVRLKKYL